ncbi:AT-rich interactive domain-containing protein 2-like isoform X2 [Phalaenopsis equestris]|uniref:AT-rich interactive domain-containing protein 2-like isoform X2 n=1 Tax=Phalaenopsis equestris TaxID=78828 RepID=UPI0009E51095|nr:AT-rich interactive domain-containing protein 2-like isoform X2 [Phalaenopsis equestris]
MGCCELRFPDLGSKAEALVVELLTTTRGRTRSFQEDDLKRKIDPNLEKMLVILKNTAMDPCVDRAGADQEWERQVLNSRKALFVIPEKCVEAEEFLYRKRKRHTYHNMSSETLDLQKRRSKRLLDLEKFGEILGTYPLRRIPIGGHAQADIPDWTGPAEKHDDSQDNSDESRWLGTIVRPKKWNDNELKRGSIGKGREDLCGCVSSGSVNCVKLHVRKARRHLKSDLGPAFFDWCFHEMGEEVSKSWTLKEQAKFDEIVRLNPESKGRSFWDEALKHFTTKRRKDIVSYYFNVYVLRWICSYTRLKSEAADSDDNVDDEDSNRDSDYLKNLKHSVAMHSKYSKRRYLTRNT